MQNPGSIRQNDISLIDSDTGLLAEVINNSDENVDLDNKNGVIASSILYARNNGNIKPVILDNISRALGTIDIDHLRIHDEVHYTSQDLIEGLAKDTPKYWHFKTPNTSTRVHLIFRVNTTTEAVIELYESPTLTNDGTALSIYNNDRNSSNTAESLVYKDPTVSADGSTRLLANITGSGKASGGISGRNNEFILKQNTSYVVKVTLRLASGSISNCFEFYEKF